MDSSLFKVIAKFCHEYKKKHPQILDEAEDLICEAYIVLPKIQVSYDENKGIRFSTFLWKCLENHFYRLTFDDRNNIFYSLEEEYTEREDEDGAYCPVLGVHTVRHVSFPPAFLQSLSDNARRYVETIFSFPTDLESFLEGKPVKCPFKYVVGQYLGFNKTEVLRIEREVLEKYIY